MRRLLLVVALGSLLAAAGCARPVQQVGDPGTTPDFDGRAIAVAAAWHAAHLDTAWKTGFVPLEDLTHLQWAMTDVRGAPSSDRAALEEQAGRIKAAAGNGWYRLDIKLPAAAAPLGRITFAGGQTLEVPLTTAAAAYGALANPAAPPVAQCGRPDCALTITAARFATTTVRTSRGPATVPAWFFTLAELAVPVVRVAVAPSAVSPLPDLGGTLPASHDLYPVERIDGTGDRLTLHFTGGRCVKTQTGYVYEQPDLVVVGVVVIPTGAVCPAIGIPAQVDVRLAAPLGDRVVLDATTAQPRIAA